MNPNELLTFIKELQTSTQQSKQNSPQNPIHTTKDAQKEQLILPQFFQEELPQNTKAPLKSSRSLRTLLY